MASICVMCLCLAALSITVYGRSMPESDVKDLGGSEMSALLRVKRNIMTGSAGNGCAIGAFRFGRGCYSCKEIGRKLGKTMKICHDKCIDAHRRCVTNKRRNTYE